MAKAKADMLKDAQAAGLVAADAEADDYTADQLSGLLSGETPAWEGSASATAPVVAPDGHVTLSQEDIDARQ
jgi:IMP cyclohydrolase